MTKTDQVTVTSEELEKAPGHTVTVGALVPQELGIAVSDSRDTSQLAVLAQTIRDNKRVEVVDDPEQISREIFEQILGSQSNEELNQLGAATGWRELEGKTVKLGSSFKWRPSSYEEGAPIFLVVPAELVGPDGQLSRVTLTTGSLNVIAQLMNMAARSTYEGTLVVLEKASKPSARGYHPLWLRVLTTDQEQD